MERIITLYSQGEISKLTSAAYIQSYLFQCIANKKLALINSSHMDSRVVMDELIRIIYADGLIVHTNAGQLGMKS